MRDYIKLSFIVYVLSLGLGACKKSEDNNNPNSTNAQAFLEWTGQWELVTYDLDGYTKVSGPGALNEPFGEEIKNDTFSRYSSYFVKDSQNNPKLVFTHFKSKIKYKISSALLKKDSLSIVETYELLDSAGNTVDQWEFISGFNLTEGKTQYQQFYDPTNSGYTYHWTFQNNTLSYYDANGFPGSSGGNHYSFTRQFIKK